MNSNAQQGIPIVGGGALVMTSRGWGRTIVFSSGLKAAVVPIGGIKVSTSVS